MCVPYARNAGCAQSESKCERQDETERHILSGERAGKKEGYKSQDMRGTRGQRRGEKRREERKEAA